LSETLIPVASGLLILSSASFVGSILLAVVSASALSVVVARMRDGLRRGATARWLWLVLVVTVLAVVLALADIASPVRVAVTLAFVLAAPGLALAQAIGIEELFPLITLSVAASISVAIVLGGTLLYAGIWVPEVTLLALGGITMFLVNVAAYRSGTRQHQAVQA
jgi:uncharacterized membrane protein